MKKYPTVTKVLTPLRVEEPTWTRESLLQNFRQRSRALGRLSQGQTRIESLYPNEHFSDDDVAFGYLTNSQVVVASDFETEEKVAVGYIAHVVMLVALGYAKDENDTHPKIDYKVRGIVKAALHRDVIFWETPEELLSDPDRFFALQSCLNELLDRGLISSANKVYGAGTGATPSLGTVGQLLKA
jgi:hypothetical protein